MAFNASGVFQRLYNWVADRDAGINITASRMDAETDGIVQGINQLVDGTQPLKAPVRGSFGTAATPGHSFDGDTDTGMYRPAANQLAHATGGAQRTLLSGTGYQVDVPITGTAVTQSATDTTAGRLTRVGDFGLGNNATQDTPAGNDLNAVRATGWYRTDASTIGKPPSSSAAVQHVTRGGGQAAYFHYQMAFGSEANGPVYTRHMTDSAGAWSAWRKVFAQETILGLVSQSGGVPTGAVIERGSNANGEYVRFADGTQICTSQAFTADITSAANGIFQSASLSWPYPATFSSITGSGAYVSNNSAAWGSGSGGGVSSLLRAYSAASFTGATFRGYTIGRWF